MPLDDINLNFFKYPYPRVNWDQYGDMLRTRIQEEGSVRLTFISLYDLYSAIDDLGIDPRSVWFKDGYAIVRKDEV